MHQYRVNYLFLIGLFVVGLVCSGAVYVLWLFQMERHSGALLEAATSAEEEGDYRRAAQYFSSYISFQPRDDEARVRLANAWADLTDSDDVTIQEIGRSLELLEGTVRRMPEEKDLRRRLVELYGRVGREQDALHHLSIMLEEYPDDSDLLVLKTKYLAQAGEYNEAIELCYDLIGYDPETDTFDLDSAKSPHTEEVYTRAAVLVRSRKNDGELADRIMDQMIKAEPDSATAYLQRGRYYLSQDERERGELDVKKAYELSPDDADVLLVIADLSSRSDSSDDDDEEEENDEQFQERIAKARGYLEAGKKEHPKDARFYQALAQLEMRNQNYEPALAHIDEGLKAITGRNGNMLTIFKCDLQFRANDLEGVRETIDKMREARFRPEYIDWTEARLLMAQGKWYEASDAFSRLRPLVTEFSDMSVQINGQLAFCYEQLGRNDLALETYGLALQQVPDYDPAIQGRRRILGRLGKPDEDVDEEEQQGSWEQIIAQELRKPKEEQDWKAVENWLDQAAKDRNLGEASKKILWANYYLVRGELDQSREVLLEADRLVPKDQSRERLAIQRLAVQLVQRDPKKGPEAALALWQKTVNQFSDQPDLRLDKADILIAMRGEQLQEQLAELLEGTDDWTNGQKIRFWNSMATKFLTLGMADEARDCWTRVADLLPNDLKTRRMLFMLALDRNDDAGMSEAQDAFLKIVKDKNDSGWLFLEARRLLSLYQRGRLDKNRISEIRVVVDRAMNQRPDWHELHLLKADLELAAGDEQAALKHYAQAEELGPVNPMAKLRHLRLLSKHGQYAEAKQLAEEFPEATRARLMGRLYAEILFNNRDVAEALDAAREVAKTKPDDSETLLWLGQFLSTAVESGSLPSGQIKPVLAEAGEAIQRSVELNPYSPDAWFTLLTIRVFERDQKEADNVLRSAQLALISDHHVRFLARSYAMLGRWFDAENMFKMACEMSPDDYQLVQQFANFYMGRAYPRDDGIRRAIPLINRVLHAGADGKLDTNDPTLLWARRTAAQLFASTNQYQQLLKAEKLLRSNAQNNQLPREDRLRMARILAPRPEPVSRIKAIHLLEAVKQESQLGEQDELQLGELYFGLNNWTQCRKQMLETISRFSESERVRQSYVRMLLQRGGRRDLVDAEAQIKRLSKINDENPTTVELSVRLATKLGRSDYARRGLLGLLPKVEDPKDITDEQEDLFELVAHLFVNLDDLDNAEKIYRLLVQRDPNKILQLAGFLGYHRDADQCFEVLQKVYDPDQSVGILRVGIGVLRFQRDRVGDKYDAIVQQWLDRALRENPDLVDLLILQAELYDAQQNYEGAAEVYVKLLKRNDVSGPRRAVVLNNMSYIAALQGAQAPEGVAPLELVQEAVGILGPTDAILDTRAVVLISQKQYDRAVEDLEMSIASDPTATKYFHKAIAHLRAGENKAAMQAWDKMEEMGLSLDDLNRMEHPIYEEMKAKIEDLRAGRVDVSDRASVPAAGR